MSSGANLTGSNLGALSSSGGGFALSNPSQAKIDQQRKILEELERQKKQLSGSGNDQQQHPAAAAANNLIDPLSYNLTQTQKLALENAAKSSFGYFIAQDSSFGNTILPVIPRPAK